MRLFLLATLLALSVLGVPRAANATCGTMPYTFVNNPGGSTVDANTTNANNQFLLSCASSVDSTQIGPNGIFASQIIPTTVAQAVFGGAQTYTFSNGLTVNGTLNSTTAVAQNATVSNTLSASTVNVIGPLSAANATIAGTVTTASLTASNLVSALTVNATGGISGQNITAVGALTGSGFVSTPWMRHGPSNAVAYPFSAQDANATTHFERAFITLTTGGNNTFNFASAYSGAPYCTATYVAPNPYPASVGPLTINPTAGYVTVFGLASAPVQILCLGQ